MLACRINRMHIHEAWLDKGMQYAWADDINQSKKPYMWNVKFYKKNKTHYF